MRKKKCTFKNQFGIRLQRETGGLKRQEFNEFTAALINEHLVRRRVHYCDYYFPPTYFWPRAKSGLLKRRCSAKKILRSQKAPPRSIFELAPSGQTKTPAKMAHFVVVVVTYGGGWQIENRYAQHYLPKIRKKVPDETNLMRDAARHWINIGERYARKKHFAADKKYVLALVFKENVSITRADTSKGILVF